MAEQYGIGVRGSLPDTSDLFDTYAEADAECWREGGETVMVREVTPWREATP